MGKELIYLDIDAFEEALEDATGKLRKLVLAAIRSTITRTRSKVRTMLSDALRNDEGWNVRKKDLDERIRVSAESGGVTYGSFELVIKGRAINLAFFGMRQSKRAGVTVLPKKGGARTRVAGGFVRTSRKGERIILRRTGKARYPLQTKNMISPVAMFDKGTFADKFEDQVVDFIEKRFDHEITWRLQKAGLL